MRDEFYLGENRIENKLTKSINTLLEESLCDGVKRISFIYLHLFHFEDVQFFVVVSITGRGPFTVDTTITT